ncbi:MAG: Rpn family recombination-promoting nuclease/putative transposase [Acidobacteriota bacterium]|nr:Rpn family recombination-promoting nuclease/putative transposase [Acidobacteriota bacterium]
MSESDAKDRDGTSAENERPKQPETKPVANPHDRFVKVALANRLVARDFLETYVSDEVKALCKLDEHQLIKQSFVDAELSEHITDILFRAPSIDPDKSSIYLYFLTEHLRKSKKLTAYRDWTYKPKIAQFHMEDTGRDEVPLIITHILYNGKETFTAPRKIADLVAVDDKDLAQKMIEGFELIDLKNIDDEILMKPIWSAVLTMALKHIDDPDPDVVAMIHKLSYHLREVERSGKGSDLLVAFLTYLFRASRVNRKEVLVQAVRTHISEQAGRQAMTLADKIKKEGRAEGRIEGRRENQKEIALRLIERGFSTQEVAEISLLTLSEIADLR